MAVSKSNGIQDKPRRWLIVAIVILPPVTCSFGLLDYALIPRYLLLCFVSFVFLWVWRRSEQKIDGKFTLRITPLRVLFVAWLVFSLLSGLRSNLIGEYMFAASRLGLYFVFFLFLGTSFRKKDLDQTFLFRSFVALALITCSVASWQFFLFEAEISVKGMKPVTGLMSHKNLLSEYLVMIMPFCVLSMLKLKGLWRSVSAFSVVFCLLFITIQLGRAAWLGLVVVGTFGLILYVGLLYRERQYGAFRRMLSIAALTGIVIIVSVCFANAALDGGLANRFLSILEPESGSAGMRIRIWKLAKDVALDSPWLGVGLGNLQVDLGKYHLIRSKSMFITKAHNDYLGILSESGVLAAIAYLGMLSVALYRLIKVVLEDRNRTLEFAVLLSLVAYMVISFFSFPLQRVEHSVVMLLTLAVADSHSFEYKLKVGQKVKWLLASILFVFSCTSLWVGVVRYRSEKETRMALEARQSGNWPLVISSVNKVNPWLYPIEPSTTPVLWYRGLAYFQLGDVNAALEDFKASYLVNPYHIHVLNNLATSYILLGQYDKGIGLYKEAIDVNPDFFDAYKNLVVLYVHLNRLEDAKELIEGQRLDIKNRLNRILREQTDLNKKQPA